MGDTTISAPGVTYARYPTECNISTQLHRNIHRTIHIPVHHNKSIETSNSNIGITPKSYYLQISLPNSSIAHLKHCKAISTIKLSKHCIVSHQERDGRTKFGPDCGTLCKTLPSRTFPGHSRSQLMRYLGYLRSDRYILLPSFLLNMLYCDCIVNF